MKNNLPRWPARTRPLVVVAVAILAAVTVMVAALRPAGTEPAEEVALSQVLVFIEDGSAIEAVVDDGLNTVTLTLDGEGGRQVMATFPRAYGADLTTLLVTSGVEVSTEVTAESSAGRTAIALIPVILIILVLVWAVTKMTPGGLGGKKKALASGEIPEVTFEDVAGAEEAVAQLREMVSFLRNPEQFEALGATRPRGALLVGPPGTGKTLLARAVAGESGVPFFTAAGSDFVETFVGVGARRVRDLFAAARKAERAIVFIDEIDAVGRARAAGPGHPGDSERENTLVSLLNEMDGFTSSRIVVIAATNRADTLDPALTRPGRLDWRIEVPNPDRQGRTRILQVHASRRPLAADVDLVSVARQTPGMSGADLEQVVNEASMEAVRRGLREVSAACFQAAVGTVAMGRARESALVTPYDREVTAWHEAGHAMAAALLADADDPVSVTIVPRGPAGGVTWMSGNDDIFLPRKRALAKLTVALAGRAGEEVLLGGEYTQGASGDLQSATRLATAMVTQYAMSDFGFAQLDADTLRVGGEVAARAHQEIETLLRDAHARATTLLAEHREQLAALAAALLADETLSGARIREVLGLPPC